MSIKAGKKNRRNTARKKKKATDLSRAINVDRANRANRPNISVKVEMVTEEMIENLFGDDYIGDGCGCDLKASEGALEDVIRPTEPYNTDHMMMGDFDIQTIFLGDQEFLRFIDYKGHKVTLTKSEADSIDGEAFNEFCRIMELGETGEARDYLYGMLGIKSNRI